MKDKFILLGDRILVQLDKAEDHTVTDSGLIVPLMENAQTDGGKEISRISPRKWLQQGTVVGMSEVSKEKLPDIQVNDRVMITSTAANANYQFFLDRSNLALEWTGIICIPHPLIEAKIIK